MTSVMIDDLGGDHDAGIIDYDNAIRDDGIPMVILMTTMMVMVG